MTGLDGKVGPPTPYPLSSRRMLLRPVKPEDVLPLFELSTSPEVAFRWRYTSAVPSFEAFASSFNTGVLTQLVIAGIKRSEVLGLAVIYNPDLKNQTAYYAIMMAPRYIRTGLGIEATAVFLNYVLTTWNLRKIYLESIKYNYELIGSGVGTVFKEEGCLEGHQYFDGKYWDLHILAIYRDEFLQNPVVRRILEFSKR